MGEKAKVAKEAASAAGIGRALAVYHLDKLVESGLLTASYQRPPGRSGPGAGRPAKLYSRSDREFAVSVPPREYELAARLLVQAVEADPSNRSRTALAEAARRLGTELGSAFRPSAAEPGARFFQHPGDRRRPTPGNGRLCDRRRRPRPCRPDHALLPWRDFSRGPAAGFSYT